jgi:hypothetical protein
MDPYQQYRTSNKFVGTQRLSNPGIAMNATYDAIISGSSMAMNIYPNQIDSLFCWNSINLTIMGATTYDYKFLFEVIGRANKTKNIILSFDFFSFYRTEIPLETYLYDCSRLNDYRYLINYKSLMDAILKIKMNSVSKNDIYHFNSPIGRDKPISEYYKILKNRDKMNCLSVSYKSMYMKFKRDYLPFIQKSKGINFLIFFPPYSILEFKRAMEVGELKEWLEFKKLAIKDLLQCENVKLYDFQYLDRLTMNLSDYMDISHHSQKTSRLLMEFMAEDSCRVTMNNFIKNDSILQSQVKNYNVPIMK